MEQYPMNWKVPSDDHPAPTEPIHHRYRADYHETALCPRHGESMPCWCEGCAGCAECETNVERLEVKS